MSKIKGVNGDEMFVISDGKMKKIKKNQFVIDYGELWYSVFFYFIKLKNEIGESDELNEIHDSFSDSLRLLNNYMFFNSIYMSLEKDYQSDYCRNNETSMFKPFIDEVVIDNSRSPLEKLEVLVNTLTIVDGVTPQEKLSLIQMLVTHYFKSGDSCKDLVKVSRGYFIKNIIE